jgi:hypothetical protein
MVEVVQRERSLSPEAVEMIKAAEVLRGVVSEPVSTMSEKPGYGGKDVSVRLAIDGPCMFGLADMEDSREWSGIFNHQVKSARLAVYIGTLLTAKPNVYNLHISVIRRTLGVWSHVGRRQWDEAQWYKEAAPDGDKKRAISNETLGLQLISGKIPEEEFNLVAALAHQLEGFHIDPSVYDSSDFRVANYADHRTTQGFEQLHTRMGDLLIGFLFSPDKKAKVDKQKIYSAIKELIDRQKEYCHGRLTEGVSLDEADKIAEGLGANENSNRLSRRDLLRLILLDAETEAELEKNGIDPDLLNEETVPMPEWEDELLRSYIGFAGEEILARMGEIYTGEWTDEKQAQLDKEFPLGRWWGVSARQMYEESIAEKSSD